MAFGEQADDDRFNRGVYAIALNCDLLYGTRGWDAVVGPAGDTDCDYAGDDALSTALAALGDNCRIFIKSGLYTPSGAIDITQNQVTIVGDAGDPSGVGGVRFDCTAGNLTFSGTRIAAQNFYVDLGGSSFEWSGADGVGQRVTLTGGAAVIASGARVLLADFSVTGAVAITGTGVAWGRSEVVGDVVVAAQQSALCEMTITGSIQLSACSSVQLSRLTVTSSANVPALLLNGSNVRVCIDACHFVGSGASPANPGDGAALSVTGDNEVAFRSCHFESTHCGIWAPTGSLGRLQFANCLVVQTAGLLLAAQQEFVHFNLDGGGDGVLLSNFQIAAQGDWVVGAGLSWVNFATNVHGDNVVLDFSGNSAPTPDDAALVVVGDNALLVGEDCPVELHRVLVRPHIAMAGTGGALGLVEVGGVAVIDGLRVVGIGGTWLHPVLYLEGLAPYRAVVRKVTVDAANWVGCGYGNPPTADTAVLATAAHHAELAGVVLTDPGLVGGGANSYNALILVGSAGFEDVVIRDCRIVLNTANRFLRVISTPIGAPIDGYDLRILDNDIYLGSHPSGVAQSVVYILGKTVLAIVTPFGGVKYGVIRGNHFKVNKIGTFGGSMEICVVLDTFTYLWDVCGNTFEAELDDSSGAYHLARFAETDSVGGTQPGGGVTFSGNRLINLATGHLPGPGHLPSIVFGGAVTGPAGWDPALGDYAQAYFV